MFLNSTIFFANYAASFGMKITKKVYFIFLENAILFFKFFIDFAHSLIYNKSNA